MTAKIWLLTSPEKPEKPGKQCNQDIDQSATQNNSNKGPTIVIGENNTVNNQNNQASQSATANAFCK